jgi:hypothetical protein
MPVGEVSAETLRPPFGTSGVSHSEDEQPLSLVRRTDLWRSKQSRLNLETKSLKVSP